MIRCIKFILGIMAMSVIAFTQQWIARYNSPTSLDDIAKAVAVDNLGNVYVTGRSMGLASGYDYATVKYNTSGAEQWVVRYNGPAWLWDIAQAIAIDNASNVYVTGISERSSVDWGDYATVKYDSSGIEQWVARYNGPGNDADYVQAIAIDSAGNVYVTGGSKGPDNLEDYATVKYNSLGVEQWVARYNGPIGFYDLATGVVVDYVGNVYVTGYSHNTVSGRDTAGDYATVKYDSSGVEQWVERYNGPGNYADGALAIQIDNINNVYITGGSWGLGTGYDFATIKYDSLGVEQWVARYNGPGNDNDMAEGLVLDNLGNVYVTGRSTGLASGYDYATVKYDSSGVEQWVVRYSSPGILNDEAWAIAIDSLSSIYVTGVSVYSSSDYATVKYDSSGVEQWVARYNGPANGFDKAYAIAIDNNGYVCVTGESDGIGTARDYATIKYYCTGVEEEISIRPNCNQSRMTIINGSILLPKDKNCKIFDIMGRIVIQNAIKPGIYFIEVDGKITQKIVKIK